MHDDSFDPAVEYDSSTGQYRIRADGDVDAAVATALADALDAHPLELAPLRDAADARVLDGLRAATRGSADGVEWSVTFVAYGREVTVHGDGDTVTLRVAEPAT